VAVFRSGAVEFHLDDAIPVLHFLQIREGSWTLRRVPGSRSQSARSWQIEREFKPIKLSSENQLRP
jgi:hypothetical protein